MSLDERESQLIAEVRALARGPFAAAAAGHDRDGSFPRDNIDALKELRIPAMSLPLERGGLGLTPEAQMRVMEEIAYGDASTAVVLNMHRIGVDLAALLPPFPHRNAVLDDVARTGALLCAPGSIPTRELDNRTSGYRATESANELLISGRAGFASGSEGATYFFCVATIDRGEGNEPDLVLALPRMDDPGVTLLPTWDAMGLRATASHDIELDGLAVARTEALSLPLPMFRMIAETIGGQATAANQRRALGALGILAVWLGLSQAAMDFTVDYVAKRHGYLAGTSSALGPPPGFRSQQPWAQTAIGNMDHWLETGRELLYSFVAQLDTPMASSQLFTRRLIRIVYHLRRMAEEVALGALKVCGAHAYVRARALERIVRDLLGGVVMAWKTDELEQSLGRGALGLAVTFVGPAGS